MTEQTQPQEQQNVGLFMRWFHYQVQFFAYWFGSSRFDAHGNGGFDADDVKAYLADQGFLWKTQSTVWKGHNLASSKSQDLAVQQSTEKAVTSSETWTGHEEIDVAYEQTFLPAGAKSTTDSYGNGVTPPSDEPELQEKHFHKWRQWYITIYTAAVFLIWLIAVIATDSDVKKWQTKGGLDSLAKGETDLRLSSPRCEDKRWEYWRLWTYQFTHMGAMQVFVNCLLNFVAGTLIEATYGWMATAFVFQAGVFGGALFWVVNDAHTVGLGCAGGSYAMIGMHLADLFLNFRRKQFRTMLLVVIAVLVAVDVGAGRGALEEEFISMSLQFGGAITGVLVGSVLVLNKFGCSCLCVAFEEAQATKSDASAFPQDRKQKRNIWGSKPWSLRAKQAYCVIVALSLLVYCHWFMAVIQSEGPINIHEHHNGDSPWCWNAQFFNKSIDETSWKCLRCHTVECITHWENTMQLLDPVRLNFCSEVGYHKIEI